jgi:hypothetical protein
VIAFAPGPGEIDGSFAIVNCGAEPGVPPRRTVRKQRRPPRIFRKFRADAARRRRGFAPETPRIASVRTEMLEKAVHAALDANAGCNRCAVAM